MREHLRDRHELVALRLETIEDGRQRGDGRGSVLMQQDDGAWLGAV